MELESNDIIDQPVERVYQTVRDELEKLAPFFPNVDKIICESSEAKSSGKQVSNRWFAKAELPTLLKKIIKPEFLSWIDHATWDDKTKTVSYVLESPIGKNLFEATGKNYFEEHGEGKTSLRVTCTVTLYPENVPGVPRLIAGKVRPAIETLLKKMLAPNLTALGQGLKEYYKQQS